MDHYKWLLDQIKPQVNQWFTSQCQNTFEAYYLYYRQGSILISATRPTGYTLASPEKMSGAKTKEQVVAWCNDILRRCPCLPA